VSAGSVRSYVQSGQWQQVYHGADGIMTLRFGWQDLRTRACFVADQVYRALRRSGPVSARPCSPLCPVGRDLLVHD
jgi:hypothetical protein